MNMSLGTYQWQNGQNSTIARQMFRNPETFTMVKPAQVQLQHTQHGALLLVAEGPKQHHQGITQKLA
jgi:hypothetical protein